MYEKKLHTLLVSKKNLTKKNHAYELTGLCA